MKLLIITAINAYKNDIKSILKKAQVTSYSYQDVVGFRDASELSISENWFANEMSNGEALIFFAFIPHKNVDIVFKEVKEFNENEDSLSKIHLAELNIDRTI